MKPTSIISLIVAFVLVVAGLITCFVAQNIASSNGEFIFAESRDGDLVNTVEISEDISKIELIVENAEINIHGNADRSYVEFINFNENYYSLSVSNTILSFDEIPDLMSMVKFWESGFSFKGMRYIFNFSKPNEDAKKINIYLTQEQALKIFDIKADTCTINIENIVIDCDYKFCVNDLTVNANTLRTAGTFNVNSAAKEEAAENVRLNISYSLIKNVLVSAKNLETDIDLFKISGDANITCDTGKVKIRFINSPSEQNIVVSTAGSLLVSGVEHLNEYSSHGDQSSQSMIKISSKNAVIDISKTDSSVPQSQNNN